MKTLKNITLVSGIILGIMILFTQTSSAEVKDNKSAKEKQNAEEVMNHQQLQILEYELIENYLKENPVESEPVEFVHIYTLKGDCVFTGEKIKAEDLLDESDFLFERGNISYFIAKK